MIGTRTLGTKVRRRLGRFAAGVWIAVLFCLAAVWIGQGTVTARSKDGPGYQTVREPRIGRDAPLPEPTGPVVLTVFGSAKGNGEPLRFDIAALESLGTIRYKSRNKWMSSPVTYEGVKGEDFLRFLGVGKNVTRLKMRALNDYVVYIPVEDFLRWPVMLAMKLDGQYMSVRDKGPLWVVYPNHMVPKLMGPEYQGRWIWQLTEITLE